jgi:hypothetical protein
MTDRELLELAAKAANIQHMGYAPAGLLFGHRGPWNPLTDDGDALRLAVKLRLDIGFPRSSDNLIWALGRHGDVCREYPKNDPYAATRRAIVRAAAEIGKEIK